MHRWSRNLTAFLLVLTLVIPTLFVPVQANAAANEPRGHGQKYTILQGKDIDKFLTKAPTQVRARISQQLDEALARVDGDSDKIALAVWDTKDFKEYLRGLEKTDPKAASAAASDSVEYGAQTMQVLY